MSEHLWEAKHPYYCNESNYYSRDCGSHFRSFAEFLDEMGDSDMDMNLLFRWDWEPQTDDDGEDKPYSTDDNYRDGVLKLFWMGQRKGIYFLSTVEVCRADEPKIIAFLGPRLNHLLKLWQPLPGAAP